jgi:hypothetical protein
VDQLLSAYLHQRKSYGGRSYMVVAILRAVAFTWVRMLENNPAVVA